MTIIKSKPFRIVVGLAFCLAISLRIYHEFVPRGAKFTPYVSYSVPGPTLKSPAGQQFEVRFNDAGGMHSGNHWTWVVQYNLLFGKRVIQSGYLTSEYATGNKSLDVEWNGEEPVLPFSTGRYE